MSSPRTGSTRLQMSFDEHPAIAAPEESQFVLHFHHRYGRAARPIKKWRDAWLADLPKDIKIRHFWDIDQESLDQVLADLAPESSYGRVCQEVYRHRISWFTKSEITHIVDKNPLYAVLWKQLLHIYPDARFFHLVRDYRDQVASVRRITDRYSVATLARNWHAINQQLLQLRDAYPDRYCLIRYEDYVEDPRRVMAEAFSWMSLTADHMSKITSAALEAAYEAYLDRATDDRSRQLRIQVRKKIHPHVAKEVQAHHTHRALDILSNKDVNTLERICGHLGQKFGYEPQRIVDVQPRRVSWDQRFWLWKMRTYFKLPIWLRELRAPQDLGLLDDAG